MERVILKNKEDVDKFNKIFDIGESFEKAVNSAINENPELTSEIERLKRNINGYRKAISQIENLRKSGRGNFEVQQIEESDRNRKIYHDGIIGSINFLARNLKNNSYLQKISQMERGEIGEWALSLGEYFEIQEKIQKENKAA
jgi:regulator of replication initiation timing